jgi:hypothetical protein
LVIDSYSTYYLDSGILVPSGFTTNIAVDREFKSILPKPYSNCEIDANSPKYIQGMDLYNLIIAQSEYAYTQQLCFFQCYQEYIVKTFNCSVSMFVSLFNASACSIFDSILIWHTGEAFNVEYINRNCLLRFPLECDQALYTTSISSTQFNRDNVYYLAAIMAKGQNLTSDFIERKFNDSVTLAQSIVSVNIFYDRLSYTSTTETPQMDGASLFGSIGGNLGLFLGASVFSMCEIIEVMMEVFFILRKRNAVSS